MNEPDDNLRHYVYFRRHPRRRMRFWLFVTLLCLVAALVAIGLKIALDAVGKADFKRYEPVDVPPEEVSERHNKERLEYERRDEVYQKGRPKPPTAR